MASPAFSDDPAVFSVRIVSLDYYMAPPIPDYDLCYSTFQGADVKEVPVIRVYGSTPTGQKTCLHVHRALPYLYVPCSDIGIPTSGTGDAYLRDVFHAAEKALSVKSIEGSKKQHIHSCSFVRAKRLYGYHPSEELFVKISLYYPSDIACSAALFLVIDDFRLSYSKGCAVFDRNIQPYESHIPFLLQFMIDHNLYGMSHLHTCKVMFRHPLPDAFVPRSVHNGKLDMHIGEVAHSFGLSQAESSSSGAIERRPVWLSSTVSKDCIWHTPVDDGLDGRKNHIIRRQSICELEGDSCVEDILNQSSKLYTSLSQSGPDTKMVQSLIQIWEEEYERSGIYETVRLSDDAKPPPEVVLRTFLDEYETALDSLCPEVVLSSPEVSTSLAGQNSTHEVFASNIGSSVALADGQPVLPGGPPVEKDFIETPSQKVADIEAVHLLNWLASSQAVDDINSDDELGHEVILSPLFTNEAYEKALRKAHLEYESLSQKECQDILDSVEKSKFEGVKDETASFTGKVDISSGGVIPQVDGSNDDQIQDTLSKVPKENSSSEAEKPAICLEETGIAKKFDPKRNQIVWGSLPFFAKHNVHENADSSYQGFWRETVDKVECDTSCSISVRKIAKHHCSSEVNTKVSASNPEIEELTESSLRDLMRKKRCVSTELTEADTCTAEKTTEIAHTAVFSQDNDMFGFFQTPSLKGQIAQDGKSQGSKYRTSYDIAIPSMADNIDATSKIKEKLSNRYQNRDYYSMQVDREQTSDLAGLAFNKESIQDSELPTSFGEPHNPKEWPRILDCGHNVNNSTENDPKCGYLSGHPYGIYGESSDFEGSKCGDSINEKLTPATEGYADMGDQNVENSAFLSDNLVMQTCVGGEEVKASSGDLNCIHYVDSCRGNNRLDSTEMIFIGKPPKIEEVVRGLEDAPSPYLISCIVEGANNTIDEKRYLDFFPHVTSRSFDNERVLHTPDNNETFHDFRREFVKGIPVHYRNDGSLLYLLTNAFSPPTSNSVNKWVLEAKKGVAKKDMHLESMEKSLDPSSSQQASLLENRQPALHQSEIFCDLKQVVDQLGAGKDVGIMKENTTISVDVVTTEGDSGVEPYSSWHAVSQLSGPDRKAKLTPLSQMGFRDPASIGGGQQLSMLSLEVLAQSRGDLRPDPRFDAVNIVTLLIQEDSSHHSEAFVFLRCCNTKEIERHWKLDQVSHCKLLASSDEKVLFQNLVRVISSVDPDILMGWETQGSSIGFLAERAAQLGIYFLRDISRTPPRGEVKASVENQKKGNLSIDSGICEDVLVEDEWGRTHGSGFHVGGRIVLNLWRLMRAEVKLNMYSIEAVADEVLRQKVPYIPCSVLNRWFLNGSYRGRFRSIEYQIERTKLNLAIVCQLDLINRTSELARVFGIDFFSVLSRGSQFRVESMMLRLAHSQNYLAVSPGSQQVASQPAMECLPLVMEPISGFYADPVVVLDFQSLYPSMIIAYNLCYSTCLGKILTSKENVLGVSCYNPDRQLLYNLKQQILLCPNGVMYVPPEVRHGVLPRLLEEILSTRIMIKQNMKKLKSSEGIAQRIYNARQLALKLIANVTYGYTAAGFSGRMPCAELADSIVQCGRRTLETAISYVNNNDTWKASVVYGDTDSMFVHLKGRSLEEAFKIGKEISSAVTGMNPSPVALKFEKVYYPCFLLTKKRYVGYSYESLNQKTPIFDAKGIETVRRDTCPAVAKILERSLRIFFEQQEISRVKSYLQRQWARILRGKFSLQDFIFAKEVRLGTYSGNASSLPPAAIVATKRIRTDPRLEPFYAERVPYVVIHGGPGARLIDMVVDPYALLNLNSPYRLNDIYYISKQIIPALQRVFGLLHVDLQQWFSEIHRPKRHTLAKCQSYSLESYSDHDLDSNNQISNKHVKRTRIDNYYLSKHCTLCGSLVQSSAYVCNDCLKKGPLVAATITGRTSKLERELQHLSAICRHCGGGDWVVERGVKCNSLACAVFYERIKVQKELQAASVVASEAGMYPRCVIEWF